MSLSSNATALPLNYWNKHEKIKQVINDDWLRTGDIFSRDEDGFYWFKGRVDDIIKTGGIYKGISVGGGSCLDSASSGG